MNKTVLSDPITITEALSVASNNRLEFRQIRRAEARRLLSADKCVSVVQCNLPPEYGEVTDFYMVLEEMLGGSVRFIDPAKREKIKYYILGREYTWAGIFAKWYREYYKVFRCNRVDGDYAEFYSVHLPDPPKLEPGF